MSVSLYSENRIKILTSFFESVEKDGQFSTQAVQSHIKL